MNYRLALMGLLSVVLLMASRDALAQTANDPNEGSRLIYDNTNAIYRFSWWGRSGKTYFIQSSEDLSLWTYRPFIEPGTNHLKEWGVTSTGSKLFLRLQISDQTAADPNAADFDGDGVSNNAELLGGTDPLRVADANNDGMPDEWDAYTLSNFVVYPPKLESHISPSQRQTKSLFLNNPTAQAVTFSVALQGNEANGYAWEDSKLGDVAFTWSEISSTGTRLDTASAGDDAYELVTLTGFQFPFFGQNYSSVYVSSNGCITLGAGTTSYSNVALPSPDAPGPLIAALWADLNPGAGGNIYYKQESDRLIVEYQAVPQSGGIDTYTFEIVLFSNGNIELRYLTLGGTPDFCTVGAQNAAGTIGVQAAFNQAYLADNLVVRITPTSAFLKVSPLTGTVPPHTRTSLNAIFRALTFDSGIFNANISVSHNGPGTTPIQIPALLEIVNQPSLVALTSPTNGFIQWEGQNIELTATATDPDTTIVRVEFYDGSTKIDETTYGDASAYSVTWSNVPTGLHTVTAKAVDNFGQVTASSPITFRESPDKANSDKDHDGLTAAQEYAAGSDPNLADTDGDGLNDYVEITVYHTSPTSTDSDGDGLPDAWEIRYGTNPNVEDDGANPDNDGLTNLQGYLAGSNPLNSDTDADGINDGQETVTNRLLSDSDGDLMPDGWESMIGTSPTADNSAENTDNDGMVRALEYLLGLNLAVADSPVDTSDRALDVYAPAAPL